MSATSMYTCIHSRCSCCNVDEDQHTHRVSPLALDSKTLKISILYERTDESAYSSDKQPHTTFARKHTHTHTIVISLCVLGVESTYHNATQRLSTAELRPGLLRRHHKYFYRFIAPIRLPIRAAVTRSCEMQTHASPFRL